MAEWPTPFPQRFGLLQSRLSHELIKNWHLWVSRRVATFQMVGATTIAVRCSADLRVPGDLEPLTELREYLGSRAGGALGGDQVFLPITCLPPIFSYSHLDAVDDRGRSLPVLDRTGNDYLGRGILQHAISDALGEPNVPEASAESEPISSVAWSLLSIVRELRRTPSPDEPGRSLLATIDRVVRDSNDLGLVSLITEPAVQSALPPRSRSVLAGVVRASGWAPEDASTLPILRADSVVSTYLGLLAHSLPFHVAVDPRPGERQIIKLSWQQQIESKKRPSRGTWRPVQLQLPVFGAAETQHIQWVSEDGTRIFGLGLDARPVDPELSQSEPPGTQKGTADDHLYVRFVDREASAPDDGVLPIGFATLTGRLIADRRHLIATYAALCLWNLGTVAMVLLRGPFTVDLLQIWVPLMILVPGVVAAVLPLSTGPMERHLLATVRHRAVTTCVATVAVCGVMVASAGMPAAPADAFCTSRLPHHFVDTTCVHAGVTFQPPWTDFQSVLLLVAALVIAVCTYRPIGAFVSVPRRSERQARRRRATKRPSTRLSTR